MHRRGEQGRPHHRNAPTWFDEIHLVEPADLVGNANSFVELNQICAHAEEDMLAVVDDFSCAGMLVRRGAPAEERTLLKQRNAEAVIGKGASGGESGETASDDSD